MTLRHIALIGSLALVLGVNPHSQSTPALRRGLVFGTFSDLRYNAEAGDVVGTEITIMPQYRSAYAIFQCAEGAPTDPIFIPVEIKENRITFKVASPDSCPGIYTGIVSANGMKLSVRNSDFNGNGFLPRRKSYWAR
jgi:hypothetical protein